MWIAQNAVVKVHIITVCVMNVQTVIMNGRNRWNLTS